MRRLLGLWSFQGRIGRAQYLAAGLGLFLVKYGLDMLVSAHFGRAWNPLMYLSPRVSPLTQGDPADPYWLTLLVVALPFIAAGVALSARRLRDMGQSPFWAGLFLLPFLHFAFFLVLLVAPPHREPRPPLIAGPYREPPPAATEPRPPLWARAIPRNVTSAFLFGLLGSLVFGWIAYIIGLRSHALGAGTFVGAPFGMGFLTSFAVGYWRPTRLSASIGYGLITLLSAYLILLALGWEGIACLVMASPIMALLCLIGAVLGWHVTHTKVAGAPAPLCVAPLLLLIDLVAPPAPRELAVTSEVIIHAPADEVWRNVVSFPAIAAPPEAIFALTAMPVSASIEGQGVGALRRCIFTSGVFEEPIEVWEPGRELTFGVRAQPSNLDAYLEVTRGQFLLRPNSDGTTTLRGTTWYLLRVGPSAYWSLWTQTFLHAIHMRVLRHIHDIAEHPFGRPTAAGAAQPEWMTTMNQTCDCTTHDPEVRSR